MSAQHTPGRIVRLRVARARYKAAALQCLMRARAARLSGNHRHAVIYGLWAASDRRQAAHIGAAIAAARGGQS